MKIQRSIENKIVFFDIDGTLLDKNNNIPQSTKEAIKLLKLNGVDVAIATGRAPTIFKSIRDELEIDSYVCCNGSYAVFQGEEVYKHSFEAGELEKLYVNSYENGHPMVFANQEEIWTNVVNHSYINQCMSDLSVKYPILKHGDISNIEIFYALLFCEAHHEERYRKEHTWFNFIRWHQYSMDVVPSGSSKAMGIQALLSKLNIQKENTYAFGDGLNDLEMLEYVGTGIAMENGIDKLKEKADLVTKSVADDGIYYGLKKVGLI